MKGRPSRPQRPPAEDGGARGVQAVDRALQVLEALGQDTDGYRLADLAARTGLATSTVHRLLTALEGRRFVQFDRDAGTWHVGPRLFAVGLTFAAGRNLVATAMPVLRRLRDATRETANLGIADAGALMVLAQAQSRQIVRAVSAVGGRVPMANDAMGKAILATYPDAAVRELVREAGLPRLTPASITRMGTLREELDRVRARGYALDRGEYVSELRCAAAAIRDGHGEAVAAVSVSGLAVRMPDDGLDALGAQVREAAAEVSALLGG